MSMRWNNSNPPRSGSRSSATQHQQESRFTLPIAPTIASAEYISRLSLVGVQISKCRPLAVHTGQIRQYRQNTFCFQPNLAARSVLAPPSRVGLAVLEH